MAMPMKSKSRTTTKQKNLLPPVHPGEILSEEFLKPLGITQYRLAERIHVPRRRINEIVLGQRSISADTALRLARFFATSDRFWLNLQATYDLNVERNRIADSLDRIQALKKAS
jgi:addiction module HigA family antidote